MLLAGADFKPRRPQSAAACSTFPRHHGFTPSRSIRRRSSSRGSDRLWGTLVTSSRSRSEALKTKTATSSGCILDSAPPLPPPAEVAGELRWPEHSGYPVRPLLLLLRWYIRGRQHFTPSTQHTFRPAGSIARSVCLTLSSTHYLSTTVACGEESQMTLLNFEYTFS